MFSTLPNHHNLVEAAKVTYSRNGFAISSGESALLEDGVDFLAQSTSGEKIGVKCIYIADDQLISQEQLATILNQSPKKVRLHVLTPAKFSIGAIEFAKKKKIELVDGSRIKWSMGTYILEADRVPNCTGKPNLANRVKNTSKRSLMIAGRLAIVVAIGLGIYAFDKLDIIDGTLSFSGPKDIEKGVSDFHFVESHQDMDPKIRARRDAMALVSHLRRQEYQGTDYIMLAGGDVETALRLMVERFKVSTASTYPEYQQSFESICDPSSTRIAEAAEYVAINLEGVVVYQNGVSRLGDMIPVSFNPEN